jgi:hypothetical protein
MAIRIQRQIGVFFNGDGVSTTATFDVSDLCIYDFIAPLPVADLKPLDAVDNVVWTNANGTTTPIVATLNGKGTSVTFTLPSAPPVNVGSQFQNIIFVASRLSE